MKPKFLLLSLLIFMLSCSNSTNNDKFINDVAGRYLYSSDQVIEVYFKDGVLFLSWKGIKDIEPMKLNDDVFFVKEMNEKIMFKTNLKNQQKYLVLIPKEEEAEIQYNFKKMKKGEMIPSDYLAKNEYEKALEGYLAIKAIDSMDIAIDEWQMNSLGYDYLKRNETRKAISIFKINATLHPHSDNVYDSLGEAYFKSGDTIMALENYKKSLALDSGNRRARNVVERFDKKE